MSEQHSANISLGRAGTIPDTPENRQLLAQIHAAKPLNPDQLFKIASIYRGFVPTDPLADHLALLAEQRIFHSQRFNAAIQQISSVELEWGATIAQTTDDWVDNIVGYVQYEEEHESTSLFFRKQGSPEEDEPVNLPAEGKPHRFVIKAIPLPGPFAGLGLLVEIRGKHVHVLGICPKVFS